MVKCKKQLTSNVSDLHVHVHLRSLVKIFAVEKKSETWTGDQENI